MTLCDVCYSMELPPRARRIQAEMQKFDEEHGTTSACAENTPVFFSFHLGFWNYLRVRGEYLRFLTPPATPGNYLRVRGEYTK